MASIQELDHRTTILLPTALHARLTRLAARRGTSMGALIRAAVEATYGRADAEERLDALRELAALGLPVGSPDQMKAESLPPVEDVP